MENSKEKIKKIIGCANIFNTTEEVGIKYVIPLYQRAFAWEDDEIKQLIEDIKDINTNGDDYYIGSLIVAKDNVKNEYEVIDGQQRLTALFLLLKVLKIEKVENILKFACREKSNMTLQHLDDDSLLEKDIEESLKKGRKIIADIVEGKDVDGKSFDKAQFEKQMAKVVIFRIEVPKHTDLNRYFEIMNTRGEQLERHDIIKARLMGEILDDCNQKKFARIWNACRDMTGYVQMHFTDVDERGEIFGGYWNNPPEEKLFKYSRATALSETKPLLIKDIIKNGAEVDKFGFRNDDDGKARVRFESIITFPYFLLHVLKVLINKKGIKHFGGEKIIDVLLDDKKLTDTFDNVIDNGIINGKRISENKERFSIDFIECLLKCRYLFDKAIIKREYVNDNSDGEWSLKQLESTNKKPWYKDTHFQSGRTQGKALKQRHANILMLQACLRVSYTSSKIMHWITDLLIWLNKSDEESPWDKYEDEINKLTTNAVNGYITKGEFDLGVGTPHIVFNYLDYLLWRDKKSEYSHLKFDNFVFEFRNSVEHWYPRNESKDTFEHMSHNDGVDNFGNLCIIQRNINSHFSNLHPSSKKGTYPDTIAKGSLKLRIMADRTTTDKSWKERVYKEHETSMLEILSEACRLATK